MNPEYVVSINSFLFRSFSLMMLHFKIFSVGWRQFIYKKIFESEVTKEKYIAWTGIICNDINLKKLVPGMNNEIIINGRTLSISKKIDCCLLVLYFYIFMFLLNIVKWKISFMKSIPRSFVYIHEFYYFNTKYFSYPFFFYDLH